MDIYRQFIGNPVDVRFMRRIFTYNEKWVYYLNPEASKQWLDPCQLAKVIVKKNWFSPKIMLFVWWNFECVIHWEYVPNGRAVDADIYSQ